MLLSSVQTVENSVYVYQIQSSIKDTTLLPRKARLNYLSILLKLNAPDTLAP